MWFMVKDLLTNTTHLIRCSLLVLHNLEREHCMQYFLHKRLFLELLAGLEPRQGFINPFIYKGFGNSQPITAQTLIL